MTSKRNGALGLAKARARPVKSGRGRRRAGCAKYPVWGDQGYRGRVELEELSCTRPFEKRAA
jgi:hypothetical protein